MVTYLQLIRWAQQTEGAFYHTEGEQTYKWETGRYREREERRKQENEMWSWLGWVRPGYGFIPEEEGLPHHMWKCLPICRINDSHLWSAHEVRSSVAWLQLWAKFPPHHLMLHGDRPVASRRISCYRHDTAMQIDASCPIPSQCLKKQTNTQIAPQWIQTCKTKRRPCCESTVWSTYCVSYWRSMCQIVMWNMPIWAVLLNSPKK